MLHPTCRPSPPYLVVPMRCIMHKLNKARGKAVNGYRDPVVMREAQDIHDALFRYVLAQCCGHEITTEGDSFLLAFHDPMDAAAFCMHVQVRSNAHALLYHVLTYQLSARCSVSDSHAPLLLVSCCPQTNNPKCAHILETRSSPGDVSPSTSCCP